MQFERRRLLSLGLASTAGLLPAGDLLQRISTPALRLAAQPPDPLSAAEDDAPTATALAEAFAPSPNTPSAHALSLKPAQHPTRRLGRGSRGSDSVRRAYVHNTHTGEVLNAVYYEAGRYVPTALAAAMRVLRDWRNNEEHVMDPRLFDLLHALGTRLGTSRPVQILSGYRSKATNALMHERSPQVASNSQHVLGKALDIHIEGIDLSHLHKAALSLRAGGVGYYPQSGFVHVDVGRVRQWAGT